MLSKQRQFFQRGMLAILLIISFSAGWIMRGANHSASAQDDSFVLLEQVQDLVADNYVSELPNATALEYGAIRGYLQTLNDPYTFFIEPPVAQSESDVLAGKYGGIGVEVRRNEQGLIELYPFPDSPAAQAGVLPGDVLIDVNNGQLVGGESVDTIRQMLRGEIVEGENNGVNITVLAPNATEPRAYFIAFAEIFVPSVSWRVLAEDPQIGYIQIRNFSALTPQEFRDAIEALKAAEITALIVDLRDNFGGLLEESIQVADEFLDEGVIFREEKRAETSAREAVEGKSVPDLPIYVLINKHTASAAEIVVGALVDNELAITVGQQSVGKGSVQYIFALADGSSIHITAAIWLTPNNTPINGIGITPIIAMIPDETGRDVELGEAVRRIQQEREQ